MNKWLAGILATVIGGLILWAILPNPDNSTSNSGPGREPSFLEMISGVYECLSWEEAHGPTTLYVDVKEGSLEIDRSGAASWELRIQQRGDRGPAASRIRCKGRVFASSKRLEHVLGPGNEAINWDRNIESVRNSVWQTFCGSTAGGSSAPFSIHVENEGGADAILTMRNSEGTFTWRK